MKTRKSFLLRLDPKLHAALERWAAAEMRSLNGQIEYILRDAVVKRMQTSDLALPAEEPNRQEPVPNRPPSEHSAK